MGNLFLPELKLKQEFLRKGARLSRVLSTGVGKYVCHMDADPNTGSTLHPGVAWTVSYLKGVPVIHPKPVGSLTLVDLFSGAGGLTYGICDAAKAMGIEIRPRLALDLDEA